MDIGNRLVEYRKKQNISQYKLAQIAGVSQAALSDIESGKKQPTVPTIERLAMALGLTLSEFFAEEPDMPKLPREIRNLIAHAQELTPEQIDILNQFLEAMKKALATEDILPIEPGEILAAHRTDDPMSNVPTEALISVAQFKDAMRREVLEELEMEIKNRKNK